MPTVNDVKLLFNSRITLKQNDEPQEEVIVAQKSFWEIYDKFTKECGRLND